MKLFEDGRLAYAGYDVPESEKGQYIEVDELPVVPYVKGKQGYCVANLEANCIEFRYMEDSSIIGDGTIGEPPLSDAEQLQLTMALQIEYLTCLFEINNI